MIDLFFVLSTAFVVSIDSFFAGFTLSHTKGKKWLIIFGISVMVFLLCIIANYLGVILQNVLTEKVAGYGGIILVIIGLVNIFKKENKINVDRSILIESLITGFAVGLDGACANLSLALIGMNSFLVPTTITLMHVLMIGLGVGISNTNFYKIISKHAYIPNVLLITLGLYKLVFAFI